MSARSRTHLVLIPSYNTGRKVFETVRAAREQWDPVWVVVDGSTDGTTQGLEDIARSDPGTRVLVRAGNGGKGAAVLDGLLEALRLGFTHALTMDSDGQHPADRIAPFMAVSAANPAAMVLGEPVFDASETLWAGVHDSLFGFRVYPIGPLVRVMRSSRWMRRFDFDVEAVVRLSWRGVPAVNLPAAVRYFSPEEGGVSHFDYWRDNVLLTWMHSRLFLGFVARLPLLLARRTAGG